MAREQPWTAPAGPGVAAPAGVPLAALLAVLIALPFLCPLASGPSASAWQLLASWACAAGLWALAPVARPRAGLLVWLGLCGMCVLASMRAADGTRLPAAAAIAVMAGCAGVGAGLWRARAAEPAWAAALAWGLLAAGVASAAIGLGQYVDGVADWPLVASPSEPGMAYGNLRQRNQLATLLSLSLVAGLWLYARRANAWCHALALPAWVLLLGGLAATTSRTGLLQLLGIVGVSAWMAWRERRGPAPASRLPAPPWLLAWLAVYALWSWGLPLLAADGVHGMLVRLRDGAPDGHSRLVLWHNVLELIAQHPWAGWGWGQLAYAHHAHLYGGERFSEILDNAHNLPLHLAVELGVPAAVAICGGFLWLVLRARPWTERDPLRLMAWGLLAVIMLHSLLEYPLWYGPFQLVFGLCLGLLWPSPAPSSAPRAWPLAAAVLLLGAVGYAGWDYTRISQIFVPQDQRLAPWRDDTLAKLEASWLFAPQVRFAAVTTARLDRANAERVHAMAQQALHFSPEPRVAVALVESATLLGREDEARAELARFRAAFPEEYLQWLGGQPPR